MSTTYKDFSLSYLTTLTWPNKKSCCSYSNFIFCTLNIPLQLKILLQNILKKSLREVLSLCNRLRGRRDTWGGPNHLEKRGLRGIKPHLLRDDWEHLGSLSNTHVLTLTQDIHTHPPRDTLLLNSSLILDQTLRWDAPPQGLVLCFVCNLEREWQRHETWGFEFLASAGATSICCA